MCTSIARDLIQRSVRAAAPAAALFVTAAMALAPAAYAGMEIEDWAGVHLPRASALEPVTRMPNETTLLAVDATTQTCTPRRRPRCANMVPGVAHLGAAARLAGAVVVSSVALPGSTAADIQQGHLRSNNRTASLASVPAIQV
jgi:hypothetical protein